MSLDETVSGSAFRVDIGGVHLGVIGWGDDMPGARSVVSPSSRGALSLLRCLFACMSLLVLSGISSFSQDAVQSRDSVKVYFHRGKSDFVPTYIDNGERMDSMLDLIRSMKSGDDFEVDRVIVKASASPEGGDAVNERLAQSRADSIMVYLRRRVSFSDRSFEKVNMGVDWDGLADLVRSDPDTPYRDEVLPLVESRDKSRLMSLRGGRPWKYMLDNMYPSLRAAVVVIEYTARPRPSMRDSGNDLPAVSDDRYALQEDAAPVDGMGRSGIIPRGVGEEDEVVEEVLEPEEEDVLHWYLRSNALSWFLLESNIGAEFELSRHTSLMIPVYYSGINWFNVETKFRILATQPQVRVWRRDGYQGPFVGAHLTLGWYNMALKNQTWRIQDHNAKNPAYGGGLNVGYRMPILTGRMNGLSLEFTGGLGYLHMYYDKFYNVDNGRLADSVKQGYWGIDNLSVAVTYKIARRRRADKETK